MRLTDSSGDVRLVVTEAVSAVVPLPGAVYLFAAALVGLHAARRRAPRTGPADRAVD